MPHGNYVLSLGERSRLEQLYERFSRKEAEPKAQIVRDEPGGQGAIEQEPIQW